MTPSEWTKSGKHLPPFMRDFHDQKDLFKAIHEIYGTNEPNDEWRDRMPNWIQSHCYVIDWFLWFMAQRGYTLQKTRKKGIEFYDIHSDIEAANKRRQEVSMQGLRSFIGVGA